MATTSLPRLVVFNVPKAGTNTYVYRKDDGSVVDGENDKFSELVKIEVERSKTNNERIHLRFSHKNRYWQKNASDDSIVAVSNKPEEDTTKASCTLFEPVQQSDNVVYLTHIQTGWRVMLNNSTGGFYVDKNSVGAPLGFVDWDTLVKLPKHVAFLGDNGRYLKALGHNGFKYLQFGIDDPNDILSGNEVSLMRDGHVRIKSDLWGSYWRWASNWIYVDSDDVTANNKSTLFWPVKINENTIALRSAGNGLFCKRLTEDGMESCLNAGVSNITSEARLQVQELVMERKIYNVTLDASDEIEQSEGSQDEAREMSLAESRPWLLNPALQTAPPFLNQQPVAASDWHPSSLYSAPSNPEFSYDSLELIADVTDVSKKPFPITAIDQLLDRDHVGAEGVFLDDEEKVGILTDSSPSPVYLKI
ncbi:hypothetical protein SASPL_150155 [Salvia splendens]|uniref:Agglutinin domain-containing protein n=1 Tax=Salvia splendens TaxID=180675 RepID=A0A8X8Z277_SALSN|nr:hypothetical protein SASPL_150155 [Salvia splendens]